MINVKLHAAVLQIAASLVLVLWLMYSAGVSAQAEVVDPIPLSGKNSRATYNATARQQQESAGNAAQLSAEFYYQFQVLQEEVMQLRGLVEEQAHELKKLKQQRLDDYLDLDRRVSQLRGDASARTTVTTSQQAAVPEATLPAPADELKRYRAAIDMLLKQQDQEGAIVALSQHLQDFPKGRYAANAQYWLGETYLIKNELEQARTWFTQLISDFPDHNKVPDAKFKLAKVYDMLGNKEKARELLEEVAQSGSSAAGLAKDYLNSKFN